MLEQDSEEWSNLGHALFCFFIFPFTFRVWEFEQTHFPLLLRERPQIYEMSYIWGGRLRKRFSVANSGRAMHTAYSTAAMNRNSQIAQNQRPESWGVLLSHHFTRKRPIFHLWQLWQWLYPPLWRSSSHKLSGINAQSEIFTTSLTLTQDDDLSARGS